MAASTALKTVMSGGVMDAELRLKVLRRSKGRCEAYIVPTPGSPYWGRKMKAIRCAMRATEIHHRLTKGRGGRALDKAGEIYHLLHLCSECHAWSDGAKAYLDGMLIDGSVRWDKFLDRPVYIGMDEYLLERYGPDVAQ